LNVQIAVDPAIPIDPQLTSFRQPKIARTSAVAFSFRSEIRECELRVY